MYIHNVPAQDEQQKVTDKLNECWTSFTKVTKVVEKLFQKATMLKDTSSTLKNSIDKISAILQRSIYARNSQANAQHNPAHRSTRAVVRR